MLSFRTKLSTAGASTLALVFVVALFLVGPFITLWAINTIFDTEIAMTFWRFIAILWLGNMLNSGGGSKD